MNKGIICSGYFNPLHKGHLELLRESKKLGDLLIVIVNSDLQRELKGSKEFMDENERLEIIRAIRYVDLAYLSIDKDGTQNETLKVLFQKYSIDAGMELYFVNGGDQTNISIPETQVCKQYGIELIDGVGKKIQSSSWLLDK